MADLLVICQITDAMRARLEAAFALVAPAEMAGHEAGIRFILTDGHLGVPAEILNRLPNAEVISSYGVGYDGIDVPAATARGIPVCHTPEVLNEEVATTAIMLYLACWRNLEQEMAQARSGRWASEGALPLARSADGRMVGILGLGRIGKAVARKLEAFGVTVVYHGRSKQDVPYMYYADLEEMAATCETLICVAPGDASTTHLINDRVIRAIGPEGYLINVGRGSTVDETALIAALDEGALAGAGLDVFEDEPNIPAALRSMPNVILTPHIGSASQETRRAMGDLAIDNLIAWKEGRPLISPVPESRGLL